MKCSIWEFPENIEMSIAADDSNCFSLKHAAELPIDTSIVYLTISFNKIKISIIKIIILKVLFGNLQDLILFHCQRIV